MTDESGRLHEWEPFDHVAEQLARLPEPLFTALIALMFLAPIAQLIFSRSLSQQWPERVAALIVYLACVAAQARGAAVAEARRLDEPGSHWADEIVCQLAVSRHAAAEKLDDMCWKIRLQAADHVMRPWEIPWAPKEIDLWQPRYAPGFWTR